MSFCQPIDAFLSRSGVLAGESKLFYMLLHFRWTVVVQILNSFHGHTSIAVFGIAELLNEDRQRGICL